MAQKCNSLKELWAPIAQAMNDPPGLSSKDQQTFKDAWWAGACDTLALVQRLAQTNNQDGFKNLYKEASEWLLQTVKEWENEYPETKQ